MQNRSPEVQFRIDFARDLARIYSEGKKDKKDIKLALAKSVANEYNKYFGSLGVAVLFAVDRYTGKIESSGLIYGEKKEEIAKALQNMGMVAYRSDIQEMVDNISKDIESWTKRINAQIEKDSGTIENTLNKGDVKEQIVQRDIRILEMAYAAKRNEFAISVAQVLLVIALVAALVTLSALAIIPIAAAVGTIGSVGVFALYEAKNIIKGLSNQDERQKTYKELEDAISNKQNLIKAVDDDEIRVFLKEHTKLISSEAKVDLQFEKVMMAIKREDNVDKIPPHTASPVQTIIAREREAILGGRKIQEQAADKFKKYVGEYLAGIYNTHKETNLDRQDLVREVKSDLQKLYVASHNKYFKEIGLNGFDLIINEGTGRILLANFNEGKLEQMVKSLNAEDNVKDNIKSSMKDFVKNLSQLDILLQDDADKIVGMILGEGEFKGISDSDKDMKLKGIADGMDAAKTKIHMSAFKVTLAILVIAAMSIASFYAVIPMTAVAGVICTATLFAATSIESGVEGKVMVSSLEKQRQALEEPAKKEKAAKIIGLSSDAIKALELDNIHKNPIDIALKNMIECLPKEGLLQVNGPARTA